MIRILLATAALALLLLAAVSLSSPRLPEAPTVSPLLAAPSPAPAPADPAAPPAQPALAPALPAALPHAPAGDDLRGLLMLAGVAAGAGSLLAVAILLVARRRSRVGATGTFAISLDTARTLRHTKGMTRRTVRMDRS